jgi:hypothetical protein
MGRRPVAGQAFAGVEDDGDRAEGAADALEQSVDLPGI